MKHSGTMCRKTNLNVSKTISHVTETLKKEGFGVTKRSIFIKMKNLGVLQPDVFAAGCFHMKSETNRVTVVEKCTLHGYWKKDVSL